MGGGLFLRREKRVPPNAPTSFGLASSFLRRRRWSKEGVTDTQTDMVRKTPEDASNRHVRSRT